MSVACGMAARRRVLPARWPTPHRGTARHKDGPASEAIPAHYLLRYYVATSNDLKNGMVLNIDGQLWTVVKFQHVNPGKGAAFVRTSLKNVLTGRVVDRTFNAGVRVETASVDRRQMQYLYREGDHFIFMDNETFEQIHISEETVGSAVNFLLESATATVGIHESTPLYVELPPSVPIEIEYTEPGLQGDRSSGGTKRATLSTGYAIQVPLFLKTGDKVNVDTRSGEYLSRASQ
jgi:elongation factor P